MLCPSDLVKYPESDGQPMTDSDLNRLLMEYTEQALIAFFEGTVTYVSANLFIYYVEGDRDKRIAPDVFVVKGQRQRLRKRYLLWRQRIPPQVAFEFVSESSKQRDHQSKVADYDAIGVEEYYIFDAQQSPPRLRALRRVDGSLQDVEVMDQQIASPALGLVLKVEGKLLRLIDPATGRPLPITPELQRKLRRAQDQVQVERRRTLEARHEARTSKRRAEAERRRADAEQQRAEADRRRADAEQQRAEADRRRADAEQQRAEADRRRADVEQQRAREAEERLLALQAEHDRLLRQMGRPVT